MARGDPGELAQMGPVPRKPGPDRKSDPGTDFFENLFFKDRHFGANRIVLR